MKGRRREGWAVLAGILVCCLLSVPTRAMAGGFSGTFVGEGDEKIVLTQKGTHVGGQVIVMGTRGKLSGTATGTKLRGKVTLPWGDSAPFTASLKGRVLKLQISGDPAVGIYRRTGAGADAGAGAGAGSKASPRQDAMPTSGATPTGATRSSGGLSARGPRAGGHSYRSEYQGWAVKLPAGWDGREKDGTLVLGSKTEAGMIVVEATEERRPEALRAGLAEDLREVGLSGPVPSLANSKLPAGTGISAEFSVKANDGTALRVRAAGVIGRRGTVAIIGTTTASKFATLRKRVDAMARSISFFKPKVAPGARFVRGEWYSFTSVGAFTGGSGGTEATLAFCPDGSFHDSSESSYSGNGPVGGSFGIAGGPQGSAGRWHAEGGAQSGKVRISYPNGNERVISYRAKGADMTFDGRLYARTGRKVCR